MSQLALTRPSILQIKRKRKRKTIFKNKIKEKKRKKKNNNDLAVVVSHDISQDVGSGDIVNVVIVVSIVIFPISLAALLRLSHRKMSKNRSLRIRGRGECNGVTG